MCKWISFDNVVIVIVKFFRKYDWVCRDNYIRVYCYILVVYWGMICSFYVVMDKIFVIIVFDFKYNILRWRYNNDMNINRKYKSFLVWKEIDYLYMEFILVLLIYVLGRILVCCVCFLLFVWCVLN